MKLIGVLFGKIRSLKDPFVPSVQKIWSNYAKFRFLEQKIHNEPVDLLEIEV